MSTTPANDWLLAHGHNNGGCCLKCWGEAATRYANGQGEYESHVAAYYAVMDEWQARAGAAAERTPATPKRAR